MGIAKLNILLKSKKIDLKCNKTWIDYPTQFIGIDSSPFLHALCSAVKFQSNLLISSLFLKKCFNLLTNILKLNDKAEYFHVVIAFENLFGHSVPLKSKTRTKRKLKCPHLSKPDYSSIVQHCHNFLLNHDFVLNELKKRNILKNITFEIDACEWPLEAEHKIFARAKFYNFRKPCVISVDGDCLHIGLLNVPKNFDDVILCNPSYEKKHFKELSHFVSVKSCPKWWKENLFLLGNDFVPGVFTNLTANQQIILESESTIIDTVLIAMDRKHIAFKKNFVEKETREKIMSKYFDLLQETYNYYITHENVNDIEYNFNRNELLNSWQNFNIIFKETDSVTQKLPANPLYNFFSDELL